MHLSIIQIHLQEKHILKGQSRCMQRVSVMLQRLLKPSKHDV